MKQGALGKINTTLLHPVACINTQELSPNVVARHCSARKPNSKLKACTEYGQRLIEQGARVSNAKCFPEAVCQSFATLMRGFERGKIDYN